jgi:signal transduction histidine kinase
MTSNVDSSDQDILLVTELDQLQQLGTYPVIADTKLLVPQSLLQQLLSNQSAEFKSQIYYLTQDLNLANLVLRSIGNPMVFYGIRMDIVRINEFARPWFNDRTIEELVGQNFADLVESRERLDLFQANFQRAKETGEEVQYVQERNGKWIKSRIAPVFVSGVFKGVLGWGEDITEQKLAEQRIIEFETRLEKVRGQMAFERDLSNHIHDFNNTIARISGNAELLFEALTKQGELDEDMLNMLRNITENALLLSTKISSLKQILREQTPRFTDIEVIKILASMKKVFEGDANTSNIKFNYILDDEIKGIAITADSLLISTMLENLIVNSVEAINSKTEITNEENITVQISDADDYVRISVSDTGSGISSENIEKLFNVSFTTKQGGTGQGLDSIRRIVETHGGRIEFETELGKGTAFHIFLLKQPLLEKTV